MSLCLDDGLGAAREIFVVWAECGQFMSKEDCGRGNSVNPITQSPSSRKADGYYSDGVVDSQSHVLDV